MRCPIVRFKTLDSHGAGASALALSAAANGALNAPLLEAGVTVTTWILIRYTDTASFCRDSVGHGDGSAMLNHVDMFEDYVWL